MIIVHNHIPAAYFNKKEAEQIHTSQNLVAPPGVDMDRLSQLVANQIASTIIHEAAHGERWAQQYLSGQMSLKDMNRTTEENIAEQAEDRANLATELDQSVLDDSAISEELSPEMLLDRAIQIANTSNNFYIPRNSVANARLGPEIWGEFEMIQGPDLEMADDISVAWDNNNRKLLVDIAAIVDQYNRAISASNVPPSAMSPHTQPANAATSYENKDNSVVPSNIDNQSSATNAVPSIPGVPGR